MRMLKYGMIGAMVLLGVAVVVPVSAGGWAVVTLDAMPTAIAGQEMTVGFTLRQHGNTLLPGMQSDIVFRNSESGQRLTFSAADDGPKGHYAARVILPQVGRWEWTINSFGDHPMPPLTVTTGTAPVASVAPTTGLTVPPRLAYPGMAILAALAVAGFALGWRWRGQPSLSSHHRPLTAPQRVV